MSEPEPIAHKFYANENFPLPAVEHLRALGYDVLTTSQVGQANRGLSDADVLDYAISVERAVITLNRRDFVILHNARDGAHSGVVVCSADIDYKALAERVHVEVQKLHSLNRELIRINKS
jgi:hypothetical protein